MHQTIQACTGADFLQKAGDVSQDLAMIWRMRRGITMRRVDENITHAISLLVCGNTSLF
jgi:hypothetical protein